MTRQQLSGRAFGGAKIALPTSHPTWCEVGTHQEILNDLPHDPADPADLGARAVGEPTNLKDGAGKHWAPAGSHRNPEPRAHHGEMIRAWGGGQVLTLGQIPIPKDTNGAGGWPLVSLATSDDLPAGHGRTLNLIRGKAKVMASQLVAAALQGRRVTSAEAQQISATETINATQSMMRRGGGR